MKYYAYHEQRCIESTPDLNVEYGGPEGEKVDKAEAQRLINLGYTSVSTELKRNTNWGGKRREGSGGLEADSIRAWLNKPTGITAANGKLVLERNCYSMAVVAASIGCDLGNLHKFLDGKNTLSAIHQHNLIDWLQARGQYKPLTNDHNFL